MSRSVAWKELRGADTSTCHKRAKNMECPPGIAKPHLGTPMEHRRDVFAATQWEMGNAKYRESCSLAQGGGVEHVPCQESGFWPVNKR